MQLLILFLRDENESSVELLYTGSRKCVAAAAAESVPCSASLQQSKRFDVGVDVFAQREAEEAL